MVVQLRVLEKALEDFINEKTTSDWESLVDKYLDENANITVTASSKLHDVLYKMWQHDEALRKSREVTDGSDNSVEQVASKPDPRMFFLIALNRLAPCLINKDQVEQWWDELAVYAIDSTGQRLDVSDQASNFVRGVLSGSFYEYSDSSQRQLVEQNTLLFGRNVLETYLSIKPLSSVERSDERVRFIRQNCRTLFELFAQRFTAAAFDILNEYFVQPQHRLSLLDLVVECFSQSQSSKLFKVYDTKFFESLLTCLEHDRSRIIIQLAINALSMIMVHICHKLTTDKLLFRVYAIFGRACSWQSSRFEKEQQYPPGEEEDESFMEEFTQPAIDAQGETSLSDKRNRVTWTGPKVGTWEVYEDVEEVSEQLPDGPHAETIKVVPLFTFLYGLFPINTLQFCHHCDEYLAKHSYQRKFKDYWSRFMVTGKAERIVRQFRVDPNIVTTNEESELINAIERFQRLGSALAISSVCMSRRIVDLKIWDSTSETTPKNDTAADTEADAALIHTNEQQYLENHKTAFEMHTPNTAAHWYRELLLMRNELAFANFARDMSEQRVVRWQKRTFILSVTESKNEELSRQNRVLRTKLQGLEEEAQKAVRSARTMMRERSAYESKILNRNKDFREKVGELTAKVEELTKMVEITQAVERATKESAAEIQARYCKVDAELTSLRGEYDALSVKYNTVAGGSETQRQRQVLQNQQQQLIQEGSSQQEITALKYRIEQMRTEHARSTDALRTEVTGLQRQLASIVANGSGPNIPSSNNASPLGSPPKPESLSSIATNTSPTMHNQQLLEGNETPRSALQTIISERNSTVARLRAQNDDLTRRCVDLEHELRARTVYEEERLSELQASLASSRSYINQDVVTENKFRGRGGAQGIPRRQTQL